MQAVAVPMDFTISLQTTVPTTEFSVAPSNPGWIGNTQMLSYNSTTKTITSFNEPFEVKHTGGSVHAYLNGVPMLSNGTSDNIGMEVKFNEKVLTQTSQEVVTTAQAGTGHTANLVITPNAKSIGGTDYAGGTYNGVVNLTFDAVVVTTP